MKSEARLITGMTVGMSGGDTGTALALSQRFLAAGASGLVSFGIAGGLAPALPAGTIIIATAVNTTPCYPAWVAQLGHALPHAQLGRIIGVSEAITSVAGKAALYAASAALAVDMESGAVAEAAHAAGKPFVALRVIADPAHRALPRSALVGLGPDGETKPWAVLASLLQHPRDFIGLLALARDSQKAMQALQTAVTALGGNLSFRRL